jgi:hypothetical protein
MPAYPEHARLAIADPLTGRVGQDQLEAWYPAPKRARLVHIGCGRDERTQGLGHRQTVDDLLAEALFPYVAPVGAAERRGAEAGADPLQGADTGAGARKDVGVELGYTKQNGWSEGQDGRKRL